MHTNRLLAFRELLVEPLIRLKGARIGWLKRSVKRALQDPKIWAFNRMSNREQIRAGFAACRGKEALLITVAFNKPELIELQAKSLQRHFSDPYQLIVADNSCDANVRSEIQAVCRSVAASYISLPPNPARNASESHGLALNWVHCHVIKGAPSSVAYVGLLDHDVFPLRKVSYRKIIERQRAYGHFQRAESFRFYWPGLHFFAVDYFARGADFRPRWFGGMYADTGAGNWRRYYSRVDIDALSCFTLEDVEANDPTKPFRKGGKHSQQMAALTLFDRDWVHLINGSNWAGIDMEAKLLWLHRMLDSSRLRGRSEW